MIKNRKTKIKLAKKAKKSTTAKREIKDGLFKIIFSIPKNAATLYSALHNEPCTPQDIQLFTIENVISGKRKNDIAIVAKGRIIALFEHMSTSYANMPLRFLIYLELLYDKWLKSQQDDKKLYSSKLYKIPKPEFVVLYNGKTARPMQEILHLSNAFEEVGETLGNLELEVKVFNINKGMNEELLSKCRPLWEYSEFVAKLREYENLHKDYTTAVKETIKYCIANDILASILREHGGIIMSILFEYDEELARAVAIEEGIEEGIEAAVKVAVDAAVKVAVDTTVKAAVEETKENILIEIAKKFLNNNRPLSEIIDYTGLTPAEVESLRHN
ncbi:MAG: hypothetical protein FWG64_03220 [Firmicutes bacterium]|nr:hypothetical protein [Bacillota bacterium]